MIHSGIYENGLMYFGGYNFNYGDLKFIEKSLLQSKWALALGLVTHMQLCSVMDS